MNFTLKKIIKFTKYKYKFSNMYIGYTRFTFGIFFRRLILYSPNNDIVLSAMQYSLVHKLFSLIPFTNPKISMFEVDKCPFKIFNNKNEIVGYVDYVYGYKLKIELYNDTYYIQLHNDNKVSVLRNDIQLALIEKDWLYSVFKCEYRILFNSQIDITILNFIIMIADVSIFAFKSAPFALGTKLVVYDDAKELGKWNAN